MPELLTVDPVALPPPVAPVVTVPPVRSEPNILTAAQPASDVPADVAARLFPDTRALSTRPVVSPLAASIDEVEGALEVLPALFGADDDVARQQRLRDVRAQYVRDIPRDKAMSQAEIDRAVAAIVDGERRAALNGKAKATIAKLQGDLATVTEQAQRAELDRRELRDTHLDVVPDLTPAERAALDPKSLLHSTDVLVGAQVVETRAMRRDLARLQASIEESAALAELPLSAPVSLVLRYLEGGSTNALKRRAEFVLSLILDGTVQAPTDLDVRALRTQVEAARESRVPASIRAAEQAERAHLAELARQVSWHVQVLQANVQGGWSQTAGLFTSDQVRQFADARHHARTATSRAWAPVAKVAQTAKAR